MSRKSLKAAGVAVAALLSASAAFAQAPAPTPAAPAAPTIQSQRLWFGAAWYPEQWPESRWDKDLALMEAAGINVVRVGEFAWSRMEPSEGVYDLDWLERAVRLAEKHHIAVVIGTPTDTPPAWLTKAHPEVLRVDALGHVAEHGGRRQFSYSSPAYRAFCRDIVSRLAARFGRDPNVIGWQVDNEYTDESFDAQTRAMFQDWLKAKYKTLEALNAAWTTAYWSQTYDRWDEVPLNALGGNPGLLLDHRHFVTDTWVSFQKTQIDALRAQVSPAQFITSNFGGLGWSDNWDHYAVAHDLDVASWDPYVGQGQLDAARNGAVSDFVRGWKRKTFWVMETQPGSVNWAPINTTLDRGEVRAMAWQDVGHGADAVLYWQWRSALNGQEQYHGALVGPDGEPNPVYGEVAKVGREFAKASAAIAGTQPVSDVAILQSYDSRWAIDFQLHTKDYDQLKVLIDWWRPLQQQAQSVDVIEAGQPLAGYKVVFAPSLNVIPDAMGRKLADWVRAGGHLVLGPRSGMKDEFDRLRPERQPGPLAGALGGRVEQYYALDAPVAVEGEAGKGGAGVWAEQLSPRASDAQVILRYGDGPGWLNGQPAAIRRSYGRGTITYLGAWLDPALMSAFEARELSAAGVGPAFGPVPEGVEVMRRAAPDRDVFILINHGPVGRTVDVPAGFVDVLAGKPPEPRVALASQGVLVLERPHAR